MSVKYCCDICDKDVTRNEDYYIVDASKYYTWGGSTYGLRWRICAECFETMFKDKGTYI